MILFRIRKEAKQKPVSGRPVVRSIIALTTPAIEMHNMMVQK